MNTIPTTMNARRFGVIFALFLAISTPIFALIAYNSTYGYDQLEYLLIGRGMAEGHPLFEFVPSKGPGIYLFVFTLHALGVSFDHLSTSIVIAGVYATIVAAVFFVVRRIFDDVVGLVSAGFVALCVLFMSLNFLQPTGFVCLSGLAAYYLILRNLDKAPVPAFIFAGLSLGLGFQFKSVAAFYSVGVGLFLLLDLVRTRRFAAFFRMCLGLGIGHAIGIGLPFLYFVATKRGSDYIEWTFTFPLFHYPPSIDEVSILYYKLGWFHALLLLLFAWSLKPSLRKPVYGNPAIQLALFMGVLSYAALLKVQAGHYCLPGGIFFVVFMTDVMVRTIREIGVTRRTVKIAGVGAAALLGLLVVGTLLHSRNRPNPFLRLVSLHDYSDEEAVLKLIQSNCPPESHAFFFHDAHLLNWLSHRYPVVPFVNMNVQTAYLLRKDPDMLVRSLHDPKVVLVEFQPASLEDIRVSERFDYREFAPQIKEFEAILDKDFVPLEPQHKKYKFWRRR